MRSSFAALRASASPRFRRTLLTRPVSGSRSGTTMPLTSGKLCSQTGSWITIGTRSQRFSNAASHRSCRRSRNEVGEQEDERAGRDRTPVLREVRDRALEPVVQAAVLQRPQALVLELDELALALRLAPVRVAVGVVEVADEATGRARAREDELDGVPHRLRLVEPGERRREVRHLRAPVAHDDDPRRLLGEALPDDELVAALRRRELRRCRPVDRVHVVARVVRARAGDVRAGASAEAAHRPERQPDDSPARNEGEGEPPAPHAARRY